MLAIVARIHIVHLPVASSSKQITPPHPWTHFLRTPADSSPDHGPPVLFVSLPHALRCDAHAVCCAAVCCVADAVHKLEPGDSRVWHHSGRGSRAADGESHESHESSVCVPSACHLSLQVLLYISADAAHTRNHVRTNARYPHSPFFSRASQLPRSSLCVFGCAPVCVCDCACIHCMRHAISRPKARSHTYRMALRLAGSQFFGRMNEHSHSYFSSVERFRLMDCTSHFTPPIFALFRMRGRLMSAGCLAAYTTPR